MSQAETIAELVLEDNLATVLRKNLVAALELRFDNIDNIAFEATATIHGTLCSSQDLNGIANALKCNSSVREVCLDGNGGADFFGDPSDNEDDNSSRRLLQALFGLPKLEELVLESGRVNARDLSQLIQKNKSLATLEFYDVFLVGTEQEFASLNDTLANHPSLNKVVSFFLKFPEELSGAQQIDQLLQACLQIPTLKTLGVFSSAKTQTLFSTETLLQACSSPTLEVLELPGVFSATNLEEHIIPRMAQRLEQNCVLKCLHLQCGLTSANSKALAKLISNNKTLEIIRVDIESRFFVQDYHENISDLAHALRSNTALSKFKVVSASGVCLEPGIIDGFIDLVQNYNYSLQELHLLDCSPGLSATMKFYLRLNAQGRKEMLQLAQDNPHRYVDGLHKLAQSEDLDALFYYVYMNPTLLVGVY